MKKSDLKNNMIVELECKLKYLVHDGFLIGLDTWDSLDNYNEDMKNIYRINDELDIIKVIEISNYGCLEFILNNNDNVIWEREEVDWSKVEFGTDVYVRDEEHQSWRLGKYLGYREIDSHPFKVFVTVGEIPEYKQCKLKENKIIELKPGMVVHCDTEEKAKRFIEEAYKQGYIWYSSEIGDTNWDKYNEETCYNLRNNDIGCSSKIYYEERSCYIIEFDDLFK